MSLFKPARYLSSVDKTDLAELAARGKRCILVDRDNTLVPRDTGRAPRAVLAWLEEARTRGFKLCMVSNNWHGEEVRASARELGLDVISHAMKPAPFALTRALRRLGCAPAEAVMVGDQLYTDVAAGNLAGVEVLLVQPQATQDLWYTQIFRIFERRALRHVPLEE